MLLSKLWYIVVFVLFQDITKKNIWLPLEQKKIWPPRHLAQLSIWMSGLGVLDIVTPFNSES